MHLGPGGSFGDREDGKMKGGKTNLYRWITPGDPPFRNLPCRKLAFSTIMDRDPIGKPLKREFP